MYYFMIDAVPGPNAELGEEEHGEPVAGAYINCWIDFKEPQGAEQLALFYIRNHGWMPRAVQDASEGDFSKDQGENAEFVSEAAEIGYSLVFNCYPADANEDAERAARR